MDEERRHQPPDLASRDGLIVFGSQPGQHVEAGELIADKLRQEDQDGHPDKAIGGREAAEAEGECVQTKRWGGGSRRRSSGRKVGAAYASGVHKVTRRGRVR